MFIYKYFYLLIIIPVYNIFKTQIFEHNFITYVLLNILYIIHMFICFRKIVQAKGMAISAAHLTPHACLLNTYYVFISKKHITLLSILNSICLFPQKKQHLSQKKICAVPWKLICVQCECVKISF